MQVKNLKTFVYSRLTEKYNYNPIAFIYKICRASFEKSNKWVTYLILSVKTDERLYLILTNCVTQVSTEQTIASKKCNQ